MLHSQDLRLALPRSGIARLLRLGETLLEALLPPDPGRLRLRAAGRATLGGLLALLLIVAAGTATPLHLIDRVLGFVVAMFLGALVHDPAPRQQALSIGLAAPAAFAGTALGAAAMSFPSMTDVLTLLIVFVTTFLSPCGARWAMLGVLTLLSFVIALLAHQAIALLPQAMLVIVLAALSSAVVQFAIVPERQGAELYRLRRETLSRLAGVLSIVGDAVQEGRWRPGVGRELGRMMRRLNEAVMMVEARLPPARGLFLLEIELWVERLARVAWLDLGTSAQGPVLLAALRAMPDAITATFAHAQRSDGAAVALSASELAGSRLGRVLGSMTALLDQAPPDQPVPPFPAASRSPPQIRPALQAVLAAALAVAGGQLVSPSRWYWAVFASYVAFQGTRSRGESVAKAAQFLLGTLAGVVGGTLLATLLAGHVLLSLLAIVASVFLAFQASSAAYGVMTFWMTVILALLFGLLGYTPPELLWLRLKEAAVGVAAGSAVACLVLTRPTGDVIRGAAADYLTALAMAVAAAAKPLYCGAGSVDSFGPLLIERQRLQVLQAAATRHMPYAAQFGADPTRRLVLLLTAAGSWAGELALATEHLTPPIDPVVRDVAREAAARIAENAAALSAALSGRSAPTLARLAEPQSPIGGGTAAEAAGLLLRIDSVLMHLRQRLVPERPGMGRHSS